MVTARTQPAEAHTVWKDGLVFVAFLVVSQLAGALGTLFGNTDFYRQLARPDWAPPPSVFGPVWLVLYCAIACAGFLVWRAPVSVARRNALALFAVQLLVNALWTPVFFGAEQVGLALLVIGTLLALIAACIVQFRKLSPPAAWLFVPYFAWVAFASALNAALFHLNA